MFWCLCCFAFQPTFCQVLGWRQQICQTYYLTWPSTCCETPGAAAATPLKWLLSPGVRTWIETSPMHHTTTTSCSQLMWSITTTALKNCWKLCVTFAHQEVKQRCCGPTRCGSSQTWGSQSALRAILTPRCWPSCRSRRSGFIKPWQRSDKEALGVGASSDVKGYEIFHAWFWSVLTFLDSAITIIKQKWSSWLKFQ